MEAHRETPLGAEPPLGWFLRVIGWQWWLVAICVLVAVGIAAAYSYSQDSEYRATMSLVVGEGGGLLQPSDISQSPEPFTQTISSLLSSDIVAQKTIERQGLSMSSQHLLASLEVNSRPESTVLNVSYDSTDKKQALRVLEGVATVFPAIISKRLASSVDPEAAVPALSVTVFDPPRLEPNPVSPHPIRNMAIAAALGLLLGIALALVRAALRDEIAYY